jgi:hypothetical protein
MFLFITIILDKGVVQWQHCYNHLLSEMYALLFFLLAFQLPVRLVAVVCKL